MGDIIVKLKSGKTLQFNKDYSIDASNTSSLVRVVDCKRSKKWLGHYSDYWVLFATQWSEVKYIGRLG